MVSVLIVDDDANIRFLERMVLKVAALGFTVAGEASSGDEAIARWRQLQPDVIVLDDGLPSMRGLDIARRILAEQPDQVIVFLTAYEDEAVASRAKLLGVRLCLPKTDIRRLPARLLSTRPRNGPWRSR